MGCFSAVNQENCIGVIEPFGERHRKVLVDVGNMPCALTIHHNKLGENSAPVWFESASYPDALN